MKPRKQVSRAAIELIKRFEGYRRSAARLEDGRWTIGYGHTKTARQGVDVSREDAEALLIYDLMEVAGAVDASVYTPLNQNQFDALAAFVFNIGADNFRRSGVLRRLNEGAMLQAACAMEMWRKADFEGERIVVDALVRRRAAEKAMFLTPVDGFVPAPTPIVKPRLDQDTGGAVPSQTPVELNTPLDGEHAVAERTTPNLVFGSGATTSNEELPSAASVAAVALSARLQSILSEPDEEPAPPPPTEPAVAQVAQSETAAPPPDEAEAPAQDGFALTPPPEEAQPIPARVLDFGAAHAAAEPTDAEPTLFHSDPMTFEDFESRQVAHHEFEAVPDLDMAPVEPLKVMGIVPALFGLLAIGLIVFVAALYAGFNVRPGYVAGISVQAMVVWGLGIVGTGCVATAVYFLLERLGGREEQ